MPLVGRHDLFEQAYMTRLREMLVPFGQLVSYESDRAALDLGLQLYDPVVTPGADARVGQVRVWFQVKGIEASTLGAEELAAVGEVAVPGLLIDHVHYWFSHPEPVYLIVYLEATGEFLAGDVRDLVEVRGGPAWLARMRETQKTVTLKLPIEGALTRALEEMPRHRSLRLDGPEFRGRPLGHRFDPLRSELKAFDPKDFAALVRRLLDVHDFRLSQEIDLKSMLDRPTGSVRAFLGSLFLTYEWTSPLETEFGVGPDSDFRLESSPQSAQGDVLVVIHSEPLEGPRRTPAIAALVDQLQIEGVERALVFFNAPDLHGLLGSWRVTLEPLVWMPQGLGSLAFNVLTTTSIYLEFLDRIDWRHVNYL